MIFTHEKDEEILKFRERIIDQDRMENERKLRKTWHESQSKLE